MTKHIIDIHTHAFPDSLAERAISHLRSLSDKPIAYLDGRLSSLLESMDANGIERSVVCSIATKPGQFEPIFEWSRSVASDRIIPLASVYPFDPDGPGRIRQIAEAGLAGIKMHPYYQDFDMDDERMDPIYAALQEHGLLLTMHTGFDLGFERIDRAGPKRIIQVMKKFPDLKLIATHLGGWNQWDQAQSLLIGQPIYMETSFSLQYLPPDRVREMLLSHPADYLLFGTDSPWTDQKEQIAAIQQLDLPEILLSKILYNNADTMLRHVRA